MEKTQIRKRNVFAQLDLCFEREHQAKPGTIMHSDMHCALTKANRKCLYMVPPSDHKKNNGPWPPSMMWLPLI